MAGDAGDHCVVPWLTWMFAPSLLQKVVSDSLPSALFASNWVYIFRKVPYFEAAGLPSPLTHLWFLGVTMQFYLVWPLLMVVLGKITKSKWVRSMAILVIMLLPPPTWCCCLTRPIPPACITVPILASPSWPPARCWLSGLRFLARYGSCGSWSASQTVQIERQAGDKTAPSHYRLQCSWHRGFGGTADRILVRQRVSVVHVPRRVPDYRVHIVVRLGLCVNNDSIWSHVLGCAPLRYIGSRSFSLYVTHYPLLQFMNRRHERSVAVVGWVLEAVVVLAASEAFYQLVEAARKSVQMPRSQHAKPLPKAGYRLRRARGSCRLSDW
mgnify:CR=1 FL=1